MDQLSLAEQVQALEAAGYGPNRKLDWIGFDACLMSSIETLQVWAGYASYFVGSQEVEDDWGWDYSFLAELAASPDPAAATTAIVDAFNAFLGVHLFI
jgi:hypothetical protein